MNCTVNLTKSQPSLEKRLPDLIKYENPCTPAGMVKVILLIPLLGGVRGGFSSQPTKLSFN